MISDARRLLIYEEGNMYDQFGYGSEGERLHVTACEMNYTN
jgi:hypothetical protein